MKVHAIVCASLALMTAADFGAVSPVAAQQSGGRSCFWVRNVQNFRSIDNRTAFVRVSGGNVFALEFFAPCQGVDWSRRPALRSRAGGSICEGRANALWVYFRAAGSRQRRCSVNNVRRLSPAEVAALPPGARP